jgi:hypothetical protein
MFERLWGCCAHTAALSVQQPALYRMLLALDLHGSLLDSTSYSSHMCCSEENLSGCEFLPHGHMDLQAVCDDGDRPAQQHAVHCLWNFLWNCFRLVWQACASEHQASSCGVVVSFSVSFLWGCGVLAVWPSILFCFKRQR